MYAIDLLKILEDEAPLCYSAEMVELAESYDNSGIIIDGAINSDKIMFSLDFSLACVKAAIERGCGIIVTHHPAIYCPLSRIAGENQTQTAVYAAIKSGMSVISMHLNLDAAKDGIDFNLAKLFGEILPEPIYKTKSGATYGHICDTGELTLKELADKYCQNTGSKRISLYGEENLRPKKAAVFCGAGMDLKELYAAKNCGCALAVSSDIKHHVLAEALYLKMPILNVTHYSAENYGFEKFFRRMENKLQDIAEVFYHTDRELV